jgi:hypothetical protein
VLDPGVVLGESRPQIGGLLLAGAAGANEIRVPANERLGIGMLLQVQPPPRGALGGGIGGEDGKALPVGDEEQRRTGHG